MPLLLGFVVIGVILFYGKEISVVSENPNYDDLFKQNALKYGLDWKMLRAIATIESNLGNDIKNKILENLPDSSDSLSAGLMQMTLRTAHDYDKSATWLKLKEPSYSINLAARHLKMLKGLYSGVRQSEFMVKSYNQGQGNTLKEFKGIIKEGYANKYWQKYLDAYNKI